MPTAIKVKPGGRVKLANIDTLETGGLSKVEGKVRLNELAGEINRLQDLLYAAGDSSLLVVLQGMDTSGKDGTIKSVFQFVDPLGAVTCSFKAPTEIEIEHDFLWRVHQCTPQLGMITIFNRSHYEDVLVVRVKELAPVETWRKHYDHINAFEKLLTDSRTIILKFFLHISKDEQEKRLLARENEVAKAWKLSVGDWKEREYWDAYQEAYEDALSKCSTSYAPWYVVPADRKWYRDLVIAETIAETLRPLAKNWHTSLTELGELRKAELAAMRGGASEQVRE